MHEMVPPSSLLFPSSVAWFSPELRTSDDHRFIVGGSVSAGADQATLILLQSLLVSLPSQAHKACIQEPIAME